MREILDALAAGDLSVDEAEARLSGYVTTDAGKFDVSRESRRGIPEGILAEGKTPKAAASLASTAYDATGRAILTRVDGDTVAAVREALPDDGSIDHDERARTLVARAPEFNRHSLDAHVVVATGGTSDAPIAGEAAVIARESGAAVTFIEDIGVANIDRLLDQCERIRAGDVAVVAAGREGALPTVVAGLVDAPVIGLPVSTGYGAGGDGDAALFGMLQSCTVLSTVNIDAGFVAGAQAALIARGLDAARSNFSTADEESDSRNA
ncbi:nickel pincer cofactor biosynthesis protein LarB [Haloferacaceae archaeon DSL9]